MTDETRQIIMDLMDAVWYLRSNASETTPFGKHDREQAERLYRRANAFLEATEFQENDATERLERALGLLQFFHDGCTCVAICKEGPCPRCEARALLVECGKVPC